MKPAEVLRRAAYVIECLEGRKDDEADADAEALAILVKFYARHQKKA